jgi:hypothetical protein
MHKVDFGFLVRPLSGAFPGVTITPVDDHDERAARFAAESNRDGYFYPPQMATYTTNLRTGELEDKIERSTRPASVFPVWSSHSLSIEKPIETGNTQFKDDALIIYALALLYGTRLQVSDWRFDTRIPVRPVNNLYVDDNAAMAFLEHFYGWWKIITPDLRTRVINILYVHTRASALEWEWEAFIQNYMVFDALYDLHRKLVPGSPQNPKHRERFDILLSAYGVAVNPALIDKIYKVRNGLFHEALWTGMTMGYGATDPDAYYLPHHLRRLNARLLCKIAGYDNEYARSVWWSISTFGFGRPLPTSA